MTLTTSKTYSGCYITNWLVAFMNDLGTEIRDARMARNMSQKVLSTETKTLQEQINAMENGRPGFSKEKLKVVLDYLGIQASTNEINRWYAPEPEPVDEVKELLTEIDELKAEIEDWLEREYRGMGEWIGGVSSARKLLAKVVEKL